MTNSLLCSFGVYRCEANCLWPKKACRPLQIWKFVVLFLFYFFCSLQDLGVFIPTMTQGIRTDFFQESPFLPTRMKPDRETLGGLADMFGQMPGMS